MIYEPVQESVPAEEGIDQGPTMAGLAQFLSEHPLRLPVESTHDGLAQAVSGLAEEVAKSRASTEQRLDKLTSVLERQVDAINRQAEAMESMARSTTEGSLKMQRLIADSMKDLNKYMKRTADSAQQLAEFGSFERQARYGMDECDRALRGENPPTQPRF